METYWVRRRLLSAEKLNLQGDVPQIQVITKESHEQAIAEKDREIEHLKEKVAHYDRWLSKGVYYTNEEFSERVLKPKQQLMEKAVRFATELSTLSKQNLYSWQQNWKEADIFLSSPEVQAFLKERGAMNKSIANRLKTQLADEIVTLEDGYRYYYPTKRGALSATTLRDIADTLDALNEKWNKQVHNLISEPTERDECEDTLP
jgi:exonuclease VII large subunit